MKRFSAQLLKVFLIFVVIFNGITGIFLWFSTFTNVSLRGTISDILLPPFAFGLALVVLAYVPTQMKKMVMLIGAPSLLGGFLYLAMGLLMLIPPFTLVLLFSTDEIAQEVQIQQIASPNNVDFAEIYFRPVGAYTGGSGRIFVRVVNKYIPMIEQEVYAGKTRIAHEDTMDYANWLDENTLYIREGDKRIKTGIQPQTPIFVLFANMFFSFMQISISGK